MKFIVLIKANADSEAGAMPSEQLLTEMGAYNEELLSAGVMKSGEGLYPSSKGARVFFSPDGTTSALDGPFAETKELIAGFWIWECASLDEAVGWARKCPNPDKVDSQIEIRQIASMEDFAAEFSPELKEQEAKLRKLAENNA